MYGTLPRMSVMSRASNLPSLPMIPTTNEENMAQMMQSAMGGSTTLQLGLLNKYIVDQCLSHQDLFDRSGNLTSLGQATANRFMEK